MIVSTALVCLAANVYFESRNQMIPQQYAVALVTMNRAGGNKRRVCAEVFRPRQFSWTNRTVSITPNGWVISTPREIQAWDLAIKVALQTLSGKMPDLTWGSTHYHVAGLKPVWRHGLVFKRKLGAHVFYANSQP